MRRRMTSRFSRRRSVHVTPVLVPEIQRFVRSRCGRPKTRRTELKLPRYGVRGDDITTPAGLARSNPARGRRTPQQGRLSALTLEFRSEQIGRFKTAIRPRHLNCTREDLGKRKRRLRGARWCRMASDRPTEQSNEYPSPHAVREPLARVPGIPHVGGRPRVRR